MEERRLVPLATASTSSAKKPMTNLAQFAETMSPKPLQTILPSKQQTPLQITNKFQPLSKIALTPYPKPEQFPPLHSKLATLPTYKQTLTQAKTQQTPTQTRSQNDEQPDCPYLSTGHFHKVCVIEDDWIPKNFPKQIDKDNALQIAEQGSIISQFILDDRFCRIYENHQKPQQYYEDILVQTNSVHIQNKVPKNHPQTSSAIGYRKIFINKVISLADWGNPYDLKQIKPQLVCNYFDYIQAWTNFLYKQNEVNSMSYFFLMGKSLPPPEELPNWFLAWWHDFGPLPEMLPHKVQKSFEYFSERYKRQKTSHKYPLLIKFYKEFNLTWILRILHNVWYDENTSLYWLTKEAEVKWWNKMDISPLELDSIAEWFKLQPKFSKQIASPQKVQQTEEFLMMKNTIQTRLAQASSLDEMKAILQTASEDEESNSSVNFEQDNEDDCYGIFSPIQTGKNKRK